MQTIGKDDFMSNFTEIEAEQNEIFEEFDTDTTKDLYLTFDIDGEDYAIEVRNVKEIISLCAITIVPEVPRYVKGIINLRGDIIPVIDVRTRFEKAEIPYSDLTCIVIIEYEEYILGLIVDRVIGVLTIPEENVAPPPSAKLSFSNHFVRNLGNLGGDVKLLLNIERLIFD